MVNTGDRLFASAEDFARYQLSFLPVGLSFTRFIKNGAECLKIFISSPSYRDKYGIKVKKNASSVNMTESFRVVLTCSCFGNLGHRS